MSLVILIVVKVQFMPSGLVIILLLCEPEETATNKPFP